MTTLAETIFQDTPSDPFSHRRQSALGDLLDIRRDPLRHFVELMRRHGDAVSYNVGLDRVVMLNAPRLIRHVLQDNHRNYVKSRFYEPLRPILGNGIFLSEGDEWLAQRRTASPAFAGAHFERMARDIAAATDETLDRWEDHARTGRAFDLSTEMMRLALDCAVRALLSIRLEDDHRAIYGALTALLRRAERRVWTPLPTRLLDAFDRRGLKALRVLDEITGQIIVDRRAMADPPEDLLTHLVRTHEGAGPDDVANQRLLRDQVLSIILSGHETTAIALGWVFALLSRNPDAARRLTEEVDRVLEGRPPSYADLKSLPYCRMVFEESMRLYPPVWTISRRALADDSMDGVTVKAGQTVMACAYAVHRNPALWENPEGFDPARFLPDRVEARERYAYFPFGGGPRTCLGNRFAQMESCLILAMTAQRFRLDLVPGRTAAPEPMITLRPRSGIWVTAHPVRKNERFVA